MGAVSLTPAHEQLLKATLAPADAVTSAYEQWTRLVPFEEVDPEAFRLLPALSRHLDDAAIVDALTSRLHGICRRTWYGNQLALPVVGETLAHLHQRGIDHRVLGGALSVLHSRNDRGVYPLDALDLLVPPDRREDTRAVCDSLGWRHISSAHDVELLQHELAGFMAVHVRVVHGLVDGSHQAADDFIKSRPRSVALPGGDALLINAEAELLFVAEYRLKSDVHPLRALTEAAVLIASGTVVDWQALLEQARLRRAAPGLAALFESLDAVLPGATPRGFVDELIAPVSVASGDRGTEARPEARSRIGRLGQSCGSLWRSYGRTVEPQSSRRTLPGFATYLARHWQLPSPWRLPGAISRRGFRTVFRSARP